MSLASALKKMFPLAFGSDRGKTSSRRNAKRAKERSNAVMEQLFPSGADEEAQPTRRRAFNRAAQHGAAYDEEDSDADSSQPMLGELKLFASNTYDDLERVVSDVKEEQEMAKEEAEAEPIKGNLYRYFAMKDTVCVSMFDAANSDQINKRLIKKIPLEKWTLHLGLFIVMFIQLVAPLGLIVWVNFSHKDVEDYTPGSNWLYNNIKVEEDQPWKRKAAFTVFSRIVGSAFLFCFVLNGFYVMLSDRAELTKLVQLADILSFAPEVNIMRKGRPTTQSNNVHYFWFTVDAAINCWVVVLCCAVMYFLMELSESPKDMVFDSLGLMFLMNLDDVESDLGFLDYVWDAQAMGEVNRALVDTVRGTTIEGYDNLEDAILEREDEGCTAYTRGYAFMYYPGILCMYFALAMSVYYIFSPGLEWKDSVTAATKEDAAMVETSVLATIKKIYVATGKNFTAATEAMPASLQSSDD